MSTETHIEKVRFEVTAPTSAAGLKGLDEASKKLQALDAVWRRLQQTMQQTSVPMVWRKTASDIGDAIKRAEGMNRFGQGKAASMNPAELAKGLGYDPKAVTRFIDQSMLGLVGDTKRAARKLQQTVRDAFNVRTGEFSTVGGAKRVFSAFTHQFNPKEDPLAVLRSIMGQGGSGSAAAPAAAGPTFSERMAAAKAAKKAQAATAAATAAPAAAAEAPAVDKSKAEKFSTTLANIKRELAETLNTGDLAKVSGAHRRAAGQVRALVPQFDPASAKKSEIDAMAWAAGQDKRAAEAAQKLITDKGDALAKLQLDKTKAIAAGDKETEKLLKQQEAALQKSIKDGERDLRALDATLYKPAEKRRADRAKQQAKAAQKQADEQAALAERQASFQAEAAQRAAFMAQPGARETSRSGRMTYRNGQWTRLFEAERRAADGRMETFRSDSGRSATFQRGFRAPEEDRLSQAVKSWTPTNLAANFLKVASWTVAVGALYKGLELAQYSLVRLVKAGEETAHLGVVFRGVGGNAQQLTNDIFKLAAAQGRETSEAMASATEWARLGGDRATVNEQVRVSAMAANIANMHMSETTRQLSALMHIYRLEAGDLNGVLGMLVNTSLHYNVTLEDLFTGLDRSAGAARVAGLGLAELQAMIGTMVGKTGQSGILVGNTIKTLLVQFSNPTIQRQLRGYGVETLGKNLELKPAGQILRDLAETWDKLGLQGKQGERSKADLTRTLFGRFSAARGVPLMDDYLQTQKLAIDSQLGLNSAQEANARILDTLKAKLMGVRGEFERFIVNSGVMGNLTAFTGAMANVLHDVTPGTPGQSTPEKDALKHQRMKEFWGTQPGSGGRVMGTAMAGWNTLSALQVLNPFAHRDQARPGLFELLSNRERYTTGRDQEGFEQQMQAARGRLGAATGKLNFFDIAAARLQRGTLKDHDINLIASEMGGLGAGFQKSWQAGDQGGALGAITAARAAALKDQQEQQDQQAQAYATRIGGIQTEIEAKVKQTQAKQAAGQDANLEIAETEKLKTELSAVTAARDADLKKMLEVSGELDEFMQVTQTYVSLLKEQADALGLINRLHTLVQPKTVMGGLEQQATAKREEVALLNEQADAVEQSMMPGPEKDRVRNEMADRIRAATAELNAAQSPLNRMIGQQMDVRQMGIRASDRLAAGAGYGIDEGARLLQQRQALTADLARLEERLRMTERGSAEEQMLIGQRLEHSAHLYQIHLDLAHRRVEVEREIKQLAIDQNKEFMRSIIGDGPAQMLQKLAAFRLAFDNHGQRRPGLSQGGFFSMSPEMRGNYGMLNPEYNPRMIELRNERRRLRGQGESEADLPRNFGAPGGSPAATAIPDSAVAAAAQIRAAGSTLAAAMREAAAALNNRSAPAAAPTAGPVVSPAAPALPQAGGVGGGRGNQDGGFRYHTAPPVNDWKVIR